MNAPVVTSGDWGPSGNNVQNASQEQEVEDKEEEDDNQDENKKRAHEEPEDEGVNKKPKLISPFASFPTYEHFDGLKRKYKWPNILRTDFDCGVCQGPCTIRIDPNNALESWRLRYNHHIADKSIEWWREGGTNGKRTLDAYPMYKLFKGRNDSEEYLNPEYGVIYLD